MSSSNARPEPQPRAIRVRGFLLLLLAACYPFVAWWVLVRGGTVGANLLWLTALPQIGCYAGLLWLFGRSLGAGQEALLSRFARFVHGELPPAIARYTRQITVFWTGFFAAMALTALLLLVVVSTEAWLFFANVLNLPLLICAFAGEYIYRSKRFPGMAYPSLTETISAFRRFREVGLKS